MTAKAHLVGDFIPGNLPKTDHVHHAPLQIEGLTNAEIADIQMRLACRLVEAGYDAGTRKRRKKLPPQKREEATEIYQMLGIPFRVGE